MNNNFIGDASKSFDIKYMVMKLEYGLFNKLFQNRDYLYSCPWTCPWKYNIYNL